eukprot:gene553-23492_t
MQLQTAQVLLVAVGVSLISVCVGVSAEDVPLVQTSKEDEGLVGENDHNSRGPRPSYEADCETYMKASFCDPSSEFRSFMDARCPGACIPTPPAPCPNGSATSHFAFELNHRDPDPGTIMDGWRSGVTTHNLEDCAWMCKAESAGCAAFAYREADSKCILRKKATTAAEMKPSKEWTYASADASQPATGPALQCTYDFSRHARYGIGTDGQLGSSSKKANVPNVRQNDEESALPPSNIVAANTNSYTKKGGSSRGHGKSHESTDEAPEPLAPNHRGKRGKVEAGSGNGSGSGSKGGGQSHKRSHSPPRKHDRSRFGKKSKSSYFAQTFGSTAAATNGANDAVSRRTIARWSAASASFVVVAAMFWGAVYHQRRANRNGTLVIPADVGAESALLRASNSAPADMPTNDGALLHVCPASPPRERATNTQSFAPTASPPRATLGGSIMYTTENVYGHTGALTVVDADAPENEHGLSFAQAASQISDDAQGTFSLEFANSMYS